MSAITKLNGISNLIGNTPLLEIEFEYKGKVRKIYAKAEQMNLTGSIKDRMALHILKLAYERGVLKEGDAIYEATSGNTGISFSAIGRALGHKVTIFMPNWMSMERINLIRSLGAEITLITHEEGGFKGSIRRSEEMAERNPDSFLPRQFSNEDNVEAHALSTGPEIHWQLKYRNIVPDAFVAGVGTGGTIMGVGKYLKSQYPKINIHPLEPSNSPTLTTGHKVGKHRIQGISDEFIPPIVKLNELDKVISVDDGDSIIMAQKLANKLGIGVGISSGANFIGAIKLLDELGNDAIVVTVFPDDNKKYLSTDLLRDEDCKPDFYSNQVNLLSYQAFKRVCHTCCEPNDCVELRNLEPEQFAKMNCPKMGK